MERTYVIPLRKSWLKAQRYRRAKRAINAVKEFLRRHMKTEEVLIGTHLNLFIWKHGMQNPPSRVKVNVSKDDKGVVKAELFGAPVAEVKKPEEKKGIMKKIAEKVTGKEAKPEVPKPVEQKPAEVKPEVKPAAKPASPKVPSAKKPEAKPVVKKPAPKVEAKPQ